MDRQTRHIYVLLRNKIIGVDSIVPLCMQLHKECGVTFTFMFFEYSSFKVIRNDNIVLSDAINTIGRSVFVGRGSGKYKIISKIFPIFFLIKMVFNINFKKRYIMHTGGMNIKPLRFFLNLLPLERIIFNEVTPYGTRHPYSDKRTSEQFFHLRQTQDAYNKTKGQLPFLKAGVLIGYNKLWNFFKHPKAVNAHKIVFDDPRNPDAWIDFIKEKSSNYIDDELDNNLLSHQKNKHIIMVFIGRIHLDKTGGYPDSFVHIIQEISKSVGNKMPIFIKPHIFSDLEFVKKCISKGVTNNKMDYILTKLHPSVLASRAAMSIFIGNSTVIKEVSGLNVPIVQCLYGFDEQGVSMRSSKQADYIVTKQTDDLSNIINKLNSIDRLPIVYRERQQALDCSFLQH